MKARLVMLVSVVAAVTLTSAAAAGPDGSKQQASVVSDWNALAQAETILLRPTAHGQMRGIAMVQGAVYDAVNAIDRSRKPYLLDLKTVRVGRRASQDAAAATAAYRVLLAITPTTRHEGLGTAYQATLAAIPDGPSEQGGVRAGEAAAAAMIAARQNDGFMAAFTPTIGTEAGKWRPIGWPTTPAFDPDGWVGNLKPFLIKSAVGVPHEGPERADERCLREGLRRGEGARCAVELDADGRPDGCRRLLAVRSHRSLEPGCPGARVPLRARHGRPGSPLRIGEPGRDGRRHRLLERQVPLQLLASQARHPRGGLGRQPGDDRRPELGVAVRRRRRRRRHRSERRRSPTTRRATAA